MIGLVGERGVCCTTNNEEDDLVSMYRHNVHPVIVDNRDNENQVTSAGNAYTFKDFLQLRLWRSGSVHHAKK